MFKRLNSAFLKKGEFKILWFIFTFYPYFSKEVEEQKV